MNCPRQVVTLPYGALVLFELVATPMLTETVRAALLESNLSAHAHRYDSPVGLGS